MLVIIPRAIATFVIAFVFLWSADHAWFAIVLMLSADPELSHVPSIPRLVVQSGFFAVFFAGFVSVSAPARRGIVFAVLIGLFAWIPENLYLFRRIPLDEWDVEFLLAVLGLFVGTACQWALLGYIAGWVARRIGVRSSVA